VCFCSLSGGGLSAYVAATIMWLKWEDRRVCETPAEGFHSKWRRICGRNPVIHNIHVNVMPFLSEFKEKLECVQMFYPNNNYQANPSNTAVTSALEGGKFPAPRYDHFTPGKEPLYPFTERWMGSRAGLDGCENAAPSTGVLTPNSPARRESLYQVCYPGHRFCNLMK